MSVKKNIVYSSILTISNYLFPLITFPYISRVLGVSNIGICNYVDSIITYFCVFSAMGVAVVGVREIARVSDNVKERSNTFLSILLLNACFTVFSIITLIICIFCIPNLYQYRTLFFIGIIKLISNLFLVEWFYKGMEDFSYITKRALLIKTLYVISVFVFVKCQDDYVVYFLLTVLHLSVNAIVNIIHLRNDIDFGSIHLNVSPYIKSYLIMGIYTILTTMYTTLNVAILGYISGPTEVGYFTTAIKILSIIQAMFTAFTGVMLPHMSTIIANNDNERFKMLINKSMSVLCIFAIPVLIFFVVFSPDVILLIGGKGYEGAILPFRIIMPLILVVGYEEILIIQALMPMKKDKAIFANSCIGALMGISMNLVLIPLYGSVGTAVAYCISEIAVLCSALFFMRKYTNHRTPVTKLFMHLGYNIPVVVVCLCVYRLDCLNSISKLLIGSGLVGIYAFVNNYYLMKNELFVQLVDNTINKLWRIQK